jgi:hypothetical protein
MLKDPLFLAYFDLYSRHRGLIAVLAARGLGPAETLETEVIAWMHEHCRELVSEALDWFRDDVIRLAGDEASPDPPPADG